jgi:hypothetical protein
MSRGRAKRHAFVTLPSRTRAFFTLSLSVGGRGGTRVSRVKQKRSEA